MFLKKYVSLTAKFLVCVSILPSAPVALGEYSILAGNGFYIEFEQFSCEGNGQITQYIETELHPPSAVAKRGFYGVKELSPRKSKTSHHIFVKLIHKY